MAKAIIKGKRKYLENLKIHLEKEHPKTKGKIKVNK